MLPHVRLHRLALRVGVDGVLADHQIGVAVHALRQLNSLSLSPAAGVLSAIQSTSGTSDGRTQANLFHALALTTREQFSPQDVLSGALSSTLEQLQLQLTDAADTLTASETILVMESLLHLSPYVGGGGAVVQRRLLDEVQGRTIALASVVERPVDLLGVVRVLVAPFSSSVLNESSSSSSTSAASSLHLSGWAEGSMDYVFRVVGARLDTMSRQDLLSLVDALTISTAQVRSEEPTQKDACSSVRATPSRVPTVCLVDAGRPLVMQVLDRVVGTISQYSPSQRSAWLTRLVQLRLTQHPALMAVVESFYRDNSTSYTAMTPSQLASCAGALSALLSQLYPSPTEEKVSCAWNRENIDVCLFVYARLFGELTSVLSTASQAPPSSTSPLLSTGLVDRLATLLSTLPETALNVFAQHYSSQAALSKRDSAFQIFQSLSITIEQGCAFLLRRYHILSSREQANAVCTALYWSVYAPNDSGKLQSWPAGLPTTVLRRNTSGANTSTAKDLLHRCSPLSPTEAARKHHALCGLVLQSIENFSVVDVVQVLNELTITHYSARREELMGEERLASTAVIATTDSGKSNMTKEDRVTLLQALHHHLQTTLSASLQELPTRQLVRYFTSISKMGIRRKDAYMNVLAALKGRDLSPFEYLSVLGVMARHHLLFPYVVRGAILNFSVLCAGLSTPLKALLLKYLGQVNAQRFVKAPCWDAAQPEHLFKNTSAELHDLSTLELAFLWNGLMQLRQYHNRTLNYILAELAYRCGGAPSITSATCRHDHERGTPPAQKNPFFSIQSSTTLAEFISTLCRYGNGCCQRVQDGVVVAAEEGNSWIAASSLLALSQAVTVLRSRLPHSLSPFVDLSQLCYGWPCIEAFIGKASSFLSHRNLSATFSSSDMSTAKSEVQRDFTELVAVASELVQRRLHDIATSPTLKPNTFLINQMAIAIHVGNAMPPPGSAEEQRLVDNLHRGQWTHLLGCPERLIDATVVGLYLLERHEKKALQLLQFTKKHIASLRVQDALQVWWYLSNFPIESEKPVRMIRELRDAAKHRVQLGERNTEKLSPTELSLLRILT